MIKLEKWFDNTTTEGLPFLLEAAGRCPPEDVGGAPGYAEYLDAISDPTHPEHEHMRLWGPEQFDPNVVDRKALEAAVNALSDIWKPRRRTTRSKWTSSANQMGLELRLRSSEVVVGNLTRVAKPTGASSKTQALSSIHVWHATCHFHTQRIRENHG
ncbi:hypothetical protein ACVIHF_000574 [Bradyrhizobium sp. USDA 4506]